MFFKKSNKNKSEAVEMNNSKPEIESGISDEIIAVITAAIAAMSSAASDGKTLAIKSIKQVKPARNSWAFAGLLDNTRPF